MDIRFLEPKSSEQWDDYVLRLPNYSFVLSSAKFKSWEESSQQCFRYLIYDNNQFIGVLMGIIDKVKLFGNYIECKHNPMMITELDESRRREVLMHIFQKLKDIGKENNCFLIRVSPLLLRDEAYEGVYREFNAKKSPVQPQDALISQYFDTTKDEPELRRDMSSSTRNNINKLLKNPNVRVEIVKDSSMFDIFKDFYTQTKQLKGYKGKSADSLISEFRHQMEEDMLFFIVGYFKGIPIGIWQNTRFGKYMHVYQAGSDVEFREKNIRINYLLFWESVQLCKRLGVEVLDLFGGMLPEGFGGRNNPWKGVNDFKMSLGGNKVTYMHPRDIPLKPYYNIFKLLAKLRVESKGHTVDW